MDPSGGLGGTSSEEAGRLSSTLMFSRILEARGSKGGISVAEFVSTKKSTLLVLYKGSSFLLACCAVSIIRAHPAKEISGRREQGLVAP